MGRAAETEEGQKGLSTGWDSFPFLWNLIINELVQFTINNIPSGLQGFADDLALVSVVTTPKQPRGK